MQTGRIEDVLVVVVHYGDPAPSVALANQLCAFTALVVVVANDAAKAPPDLDPRVTWLVPSRNSGYAGAVMYALERSPSTPYLAVLNNDIDLPEPTFRRCLDDLRHDPALGLVGPALRHPDGSLQSGVGELRGLLRWGYFDIDPGPELVACDVVTGAVLFVSRAALDAVGWDTSYFLGFEDVELCRRMRDHGYAVSCDGRVSAVHHGGKVIGSYWSYYYIRNRLWFARRHYPRWRTCLIAANAVWIAGKSVLGDVRHRRRFSQSTLFVHGVLDGLRPGLAHRDQPLPDEPRAQAIARPLTRGADAGG